MSLGSCCSCLLAIGTMVHNIDTIKASRNGTGFKLLMKSLFADELTLTILVAPVNWNLWSWAILWVGYLIGIGLAVCQIRIENQWFASRRRDIEQGQSDGESISSADWTRNRVRLCTDTKNARLTEVAS